MRGGPARGALAALVLGCAVAAAPTASAAIPDSLRSSCQRRDAADGRTSDGVRLGFYLCDDGTAPGGGTRANPGAVRAVAVPESYAGYEGLPRKATARAASGADSAGNVALDVDLTFPDTARFAPPRSGYPLVVLMHGCCGGSRKSIENDTADGAPNQAEAWHYSNAWFASRGYAVLTYSSRGFVDARGNGSTGYTEFQSRRYEVNDYQHLAGQLADTSFAIGGRTARVDGRRVVVTSGSYGAGLTWMALTDPTWRSPGGRAMRLVAAAPKYGWTNLVDAIVPNGADMRDRLPPTDPGRAGQPLGTLKRTIMAGLFLSGEVGFPTLPPPGPRATFPGKIAQAFVCLELPLPLTLPHCVRPVREMLPEFLHDGSAYFQNDFFARIARDPAARVPVFSAGTFTDPLFPHPEHRRMVERLKATVRGYPVQEYYGDYQHFAQNKRKEWNDLCGSDHHVCRPSDRDVVRAGITSRLNRFLDHYARPQGNPREPRPSFDVTAGLQICPPTAGGAFPSSEPGERFTASSFAALAPDRLVLRAAGTQTTLSKALPNGHALNADPLLNQLANGNHCPMPQGGAGPGVAVYDFGPLDRDAVMIGQPRVTVPHTGIGDTSELQLNSRLYDVLPDGRMLMVTRGVKRLTRLNETSVLDMHGNGWRFRRGHRLRLELTQDDDPYVRFAELPSSLTLTGATLDLPVRRGGPDAAIAAPTLASDAGTTGRFRVTVGGRSGELTGTTGREASVADTRSRRSRALAFGGATVRGRAGRTYRIRARLRGVAGEVGRTASALVTVPVDDRSRSHRFSRGWRRARLRGAWHGGVTRTSRPGASMRLRIRGDRIYIVGTRSRRGGRATVVLNGKRRTVSFRGRRTERRRVVAELRGRRRGVNRLRIVARGRVEIDAVGARRR